MAVQMSAWGFRNAFEEMAFWIRAVVVLVGIVAFGTVAAAVFSLAIPSALRVFLDTYFLANFFTELIWLVAVSFVLGRVLFFPVFVFFGLLVLRFELEPITTWVRILNVAFLRKGLMPAAYPAAIVILSGTVFLFLTFGPWYGVIALWILILFSSMLLFGMMMSDVLGAVISMPRVRLTKRLDDFDAEAPPTWLLFSVLGSLVAALAVCVGLGLSLKRQTMNIDFRVANEQMRGSIFAVTSNGVIAKRADNSNDLDGYIFVPYSSLLVK